MFADFQADGRWPCANERVNRTERVWGRAAEQVFRTRGLMPSGTRFESKLSTLSWHIGTEFRSSSVQLCQVGTEWDGFGTHPFVVDPKFKVLHWSVHQFEIIWLKFFLWIKIVAKQGQNSRTFGTFTPDDDLFVGGWGWDAINKAEFHHTKNHFSQVQSQSRQQFQRSLWKCSRTEGRHTIPQAHLNCVPGERMKMESGRSVDQILSESHQTFKRVCAAALFDNIFISCVSLPGVVLMVRVVGFGSSGPEFESCSAVEFIPSGLNLACHPSEVGKMSASMLVCEVQHRRAWSFTPRK